MKNRIKKSNADRAVTISAYVFMAFFAIACLYPIVLTFSVALSSEKEIAKYGYSILPRGFTFDTFKYILVNSGGKIARAYGVSIFITVVGTLLSMFVTSMLAFAVSIKSLKYRNVISFICNFTIIFSAGLIPWYIVCVNYYGLKNNIWGLILPLVFNVWNMFILRTHFMAIPPSLYEAARIDGAGFFWMYLRIGLPLAKTGLLTVGLMYVLSYWNDYWHALIFINDKELFPLQYYLYSILSNVNAVSSGRIPAGASAGMTLPAETIKMAITVITIGPIIFIYPFVQKFFVKGIMSGAVKE